MNISKRLSKNVISNDVIGEAINDESALRMAKKPKKGKKEGSPHGRSRTTNLTDESGFEHDQTGSVANVHWRAIPMEDLRLHPNFKALPLTSDVELNSEHDYAQFRQDSIQWDLLHAGRLTTSKAAACLGLYEPFSAKVLGVPRGLTSHSRAVGAWRQLQSDAMSLKDMQAYKESSRISVKGSHSRSTMSGLSRWTTGDSNPNNAFFAAEYTPKPEKRKKAWKHGRTDSNQARLAWGSAQEATGILATVNYMHRLEMNFGQRWSNGGSFAVQEVGLCPLEAIDLAATHPEAALWCARGELPLIGASPDGLLVNSISGETQALEVKCSSPFMHTSSRSHRLRVSDRLSRQGVGVWHIPQLQLEMLCAGPSCRAAVVVSLSALKGATLYQVPRDDAYIYSMLVWLRRFHLTFTVLRHNGPPPQNFFNSSTPGYIDLLEHTRRIAEGAKEIYKMHQSEVQRDDVNNNFFFYS